jgi:hypothetical protein
MKRRRLRLAWCLVPLTLVILAAQAIPVSAATNPAGYCSRSFRPGCVESTGSISTLTADSASFFLFKGGSLTINICKTYSNSAALGGQFGPIKNFVNINFGVSLTTSYEICTGASTPVPSTGFWHWHGSARRWQSKVYDGLLCGAKFCIQNFSFPIAQDRWFFRPTKG